MDYLLFEFTENIDSILSEESLIEYNSKLNLNVVKGTQTPAVNFQDQETQTFTKSSGESSDSDKDLLRTLQNLVDTATETRKIQEMSDSDNDIRKLFGLVDTKTMTQSKENSDSDK